MVFHMQINVDPVCFYCFGIPIRWYALAYIVGIFSGAYIAKSAVKSLKTFDNRYIDNFINWAVIAIILGGRLGHVLFYDLEFFFQKPLEIFKIWNGGMSFHGGLIGIIIACILFCKRYPVKLIDLLDALSLATPLGLFLGRIANFINGELYGKLWHSPYAFYFADGLPRHPSQLYEAFSEGILLFVIEWYVYKKMPHKRGLLSGIFCIMYAFSRLICEIFREPDTGLNYILLSDTGFTIGQILSIPLLCVGIWLIHKARVKI